MLFAVPRLYLFRFVCRLRFVRMMASMENTDNTAPPSHSHIVILLLSPVCGVSAGTAAVDCGSAASGLDSVVTGLGAVVVGL